MFVLTAMGIVVATIVLGLWAGHLSWCLTTAPVTLPWVVATMAVQTFLYTGLFITAHDAMHGTVSRHPVVNRVVGALAAFLFAGMSYRRLHHNHHRHHAHPAHDTDDPDFHPSSRLLPWFAAFLWRYTTWSQIVVMGLAYNVFAHGLGVDQTRLWLFWIVPALGATVQLFVVGTYLPHRRPHTAAMEHNARSMPRNHVLAFVACYFFGYHQEHHRAPWLPWWRLWQIR